MTELNLYTWFTERQVTVCPAHFVVIENEITQEKLNWIYEKLSGRFCLVECQSVDTDDYIWFAHRQWPAFECPLEATYFQLIWS
jgi:hypothetical protein